MPSKHNYIFYLALSLVSFLSPVRLENIIGTPDVCLTYIFLQGTLLPKKQPTCSKQGFPELEMKVVMARE